MPDPKAAGCGISVVFQTLQSQVAGDVISGAILDYVGMDVPAKLGDSRLNSGRIIRLFGRSDPFNALLHSIDHSVCLSAALCIVVKRCKISLWCV